MDLWTLSYLVLWAIVVIEGLAIIVLLRTVGMYFLSSRDAIARDGLVMGTRAPQFTAVRTDGATVPSSQMLGSWSILMFASPTCQICMGLLPSLEGWADGFDPSVKLWVLVRGDVQQATLIENETRAVVPILAIGEHGVAEKYKVRVSPFVHVLDPDGIVRSKGLVNSKQHLEHLLAEAGLHHPSLAAHATPSTAEV